MVSTEIIKQLRSQHGWTQEHLATVSGLSTRTVQRIECSGECSLESKMALAAAFNVAPHYLLEQTRNMPPPRPVSYVANLCGWSLLISTLLGLLIIQGNGVIYARLHICAVIMLVTIIALALRTMDIRELMAIVPLVLGIHSRESHISIQHAILYLRQLISFTYISAVFAWLFFAGYLVYPGKDINPSFMLEDAALACAVYAVFVAEFILRSAKLRLEQQLLQANRALEPTTTNG